MNAVPPLAVSPASDPSGRPIVRFDVANRAGTKLVGELLAVAAEHGCRSMGLSGPLGAGKTELVRAVVESLGGSPREVASPSYVLEHLYQVSPVRASAPRLMSHWDLFRLTGPDAPADLVERLGEPGVLTVIEWPERCPGLADLLAFHLELGFTESNGSTVRLTECVSSRLIHLSSRICGASVIGRAEDGSGRDFGSPEEPFDDPLEACLDHARRHPEIDTGRCGLRVGGERGDDGG